MYMLLYYFPIPIIILVLQTVIGVIFSDLIHLPDLMLIFVVYSTYCSSRFTSQLVSAYSGFCEDVVSSAPFGTHTLVRVVLSYILGHTVQWRMRNSSIAPVILVICALIVKYVLYLILGVLFSIPNMISFLFSISVLYEIGYTIIVTPILFSFLSLIPSAYVKNKT